MQRSVAMLLSALWISPAFAGDETDAWLAQQDDARVLRFADGTPAVTSAPRHSSDGNLVVSGLRRADEGVAEPVAPASTGPRVSVPHVNVTARRPTSSSTAATERGSAAPATSSAVAAPAASGDSLAALRERVARTEPTDWKDLEANPPQQRSISQLTPADENPVLLSDEEQVERLGVAPRSLSTHRGEDDPEESAADDAWSTNVDSVDVPQASTPALGRHLDEEDMDGDRSDATFDGWARDQVLTAWHPRGSTLREHDDFHTRVVFNVDGTGHVSSPVVVYTNASSDFHDSIQKAISKAELRAPPEGEGQGIVVDFYADPDFR